MPLVSSGFGVPQSFYMRLCFLVSSNIWSWYQFTLQSSSYHINLMLLVIDLFRFLNNSLFLCLFQFLHFNLSFYPNIIIVWIKEGICPSLPSIVHNTEACGQKIPSLFSRKCRLITFSCVTRSIYLFIKLLQ